MVHCRSQAPGFDSVGNPKKDWTVHFYYITHDSVQDVFIQISGFLKVWFLFSVLFTMVYIYMLWLFGEAVFGLGNGNVWQIAVHCKSSQSSPQASVCSHCKTNHKGKENPG